MSAPNRAPWMEWDFFLRASANKVPGVIVGNKYANNPAVGTSVEDVWEQGGVLSFLTAGETMNVVSSSSADDGSPAGTGAHSVTLFGLTDDYIPLQEMVVLNGTSVVTTNNAFFRINRMRVDASGSSGSNVGDITVTASTSATVQGSIGGTFGSSTKSQYTVLSGFFCFIRVWTVGTEINDQIQADLQGRNQGGPWILRQRLNFTETAMQQTFSVPLRFEPKSDIRVQAERISGGAAAQVSSFYEMHLVREDLVSPSVGGELI